MAAEHFTFMQKEFTLKRMQIIALKVRGLTDKQIGAYMNMSESTVKSHLTIIRLMLNTDTYGIQTDGLANNFTKDGFYMGRNLFEGRTDLPWHTAHTIAQQK